MGVSVDTNPPEDNRVNTEENNEEREEGEIVDEFEDIISSDEEFSMRRRIEELEQRNLELEKIENISGIYDYDLGYTKEHYKSSHASIELSDIEDYYPSGYKRKHLKIKKLSTAATAVGSKNYDFLSDDIYERKRSKKRIVSSRSTKGNSLRSRARSRKRKHQKVTKSRRKSEKIRKKSIFEDVSSDDELCALDRDELRKAVKRDVKAAPQKGEVRNKNLKTSVQSVSPKVVSVIDLVKEEEEEEEKGQKSSISIDDGDSDNSVTLEEQELRLIALKSAVVRKHIARKKRRENEDKKPYSPSQFVELVGTPPSPKNSIESGPMDISPIASPECLSDDCNKPVDMDLVNSSNSSSPIFVGQEDDWMPIDQIPLPADINNLNPVVLHSPVPIKINSLEIQPNQDQQDIDAEEDDDEKLEINIRSSSPEPTDEEELALRALLLAKVHGSKVGKVNNNSEKYPKKLTEEREKIIPNLNVSTNSNLEEGESVNNKDKDMDADNILKDLLLANMKHKSLNKTELVLKEAVKRLKSNTQSVKSECNKSVSPIMTDSMSTVDTEQFPQDVDYKILNASLGILTGKFLNFELNNDIKDVVSNMEKCTLSYKEEGENKNTSPVAVSNAVVENDVNYISDTRENPVTFYSYSKNVQPNAEIENKDNNYYVLNNENENQVSNVIHVKTPIARKSIKNKIPINISRPALKQIPITTAVKPVNNTVKALNIQKSKNKIVRNTTKVINKSSNQQSIVLKRKISSKSLNSIQANKKLKLTPTLTLQKNMKKSNTRLITTMNIPKVPTMIIRLGESDSESDESEGDTNVPGTSSNLRDDYFDNASPMSLPMDSPCYSPLPFVTTNPTAVAVNNEKVNNEVKANAQKSIPNDIFQARLDEFLKKARSRVEQTKKKVSTSSEDTPETPVAVRHLPPSYQLEYHRLIKRMKILEKQKLTRNSGSKSDLERLKVTIKNDQAVEVTKGNLKAVTSSIHRTITINNPILSNTAEGSNIGTENNSTNIPSKKSIADNACTLSKPETANRVKDDVNKVNNSVEKSKEGKLKTEAVNTKEPFKGNASSKQNNLELLVHYETNYKKNSSCLFENIAKAIELVHSAKEEKLKKFALETKLKQLRNEIQRVETELENQNKKIDTIYPEISHSHKSIVDLKSKCMKLEKLSINLGKNVKGKDYRLPGNAKAAILEKSKQLSIEIKNLKQLKANNATTVHGEDNNSKQTNIVSDERTQEHSKEEVDRSRNVEQTKEGNLKRKLDESVKNITNTNSENIENACKANDTGTYNQCLPIENAEGRKSDMNHINTISENTQENVLKDQIPCLHSREKPDVAGSKTSINECDWNESDNCKNRIKVPQINAMQGSEACSQQDVQKDLETEKQSVNLQRNEIRKNVQNESAQWTVDSNQNNLKTSELANELENGTEFITSVDKIPICSLKNASDEIDDGGATVLNEFSTETNVEVNCDEDINSVENAISGIPIHEEELPRLRFTMAIEDSTNISKGNTSQQSNEFKITQYISPLPQVTNESFRSIDPFDIVCPFQLMGQCDDKDCIFAHFLDNSEYS